MRGICGERSHVAARGSTWRGGNKAATKLPPKRLFIGIAQPLPYFPFRPFIRTGTIALVPRPPRTSEQFGFTYP